MITITAFKWVPPFAQGQVRDLRVRWALEELGLPYQVERLGFSESKKPPHRARQPFGQVPTLEEDGESLFESGAILLHLAGKGPGLLPADPAARRRAITWLFAALNTIEPPLADLAEVDFFIEDETLKALRRPAVLEQVRLRLGELQDALGGRDWLAGEFSVADLMMSTVLRIAGHTDVLAEFPALTAFKARCEARPAFQTALAGQLADFDAEPPAWWAKPSQPG